MSLDVRPFRQIHTPAHAGHKENKMQNLKIAREIIVLCQAILRPVCSPSIRIDPMLKFSFAAPLLCLLAVSLSLATTGCEDVEKSEPFEFAPSAFVTPTSAERATFEAAIAASAATAATLPLAEDEPVYVFLEQILTDHPEVFAVGVAFTPAYAGRPLYISVHRGATGLLRTENPGTAAYGSFVWFTDALDTKAGFWEFYPSAGAGELGDITTVTYLAPVVKDGVTVAILISELGPPGSQAMIAGAKRRSPSA